MFSGLFDFARVRTPSQALGWYGFWLLLVVLCGGIVGAIVALVQGLDDPGSDEFRMLAMQLGGLVALVFVSVLSVILLKEKGRGKDPLWILLCLVAVIASVFGGALLGLIIPAVLTTKEIIVSEEPKSDAL